MFHPREALSNFFSTREPLVSSTASSSQPQMRGGTFLISETTSSRMLRVTLMSSGARVMRGATSLIRSTAITLTGRYLKMKTF